MTHTKMANCNRRLPIKSGFTLIECTVVVTCVGLLIGMVQPSLLSARNKSKLSVCLDRLRAIGEASTQYSNDDLDNMAIPIHPFQFNQDSARPLFIGTYDWGGKSGIGFEGYVDSLSGPLSGRFSTLAGFGPATRPLNNYLYANEFFNHLNPDLNHQNTTADTKIPLNKYRCPADDGPPGGGHCPDWLQNPQRSSFDHFGNSYAANIFMIGGGQGSELMSNSPYYRPLSRVLNPMRTLNYEENIGNWAWAAKNEIPSCLWLGQGVDPGPTKVIRGWHGEDWMFNRAFVDAHAERQKVYIEGTEDDRGFAHHYFTEIVFPDDPQSQNVFSCSIIRGPGWQKDTLPDDLMPTGLPFFSSGRPSFEGCSPN